MSDGAWLALGWFGRVFGGPGALRAILGGLLRGVGRLNGNTPACQAGAWRDEGERRVAAHVHLRRRVS